MMLLWLLGCFFDLDGKGDDDDDECSDAAETFTANAPSAVDVLWVVDDSPDMAEVQRNVAAGAEDFLSHFEDVSFHLGVVTTDLSGEDAATLAGSPSVLTPEVAGYADAFRARVQAGTDGGDREQGLGAAVLAVTTPLAETSNAGFLRSEARLAVVFVSTEDDCSGLAAEGSGEDCYLEPDELDPVADIVGTLGEAAADVLLTGIVSIDAACDHTAPGDRYVEAIAATGATPQDVCPADLSGAMDALGADLLRPTRRFVLDADPDPDTMSVFVGGVEVEADATDGWTWEAPAIVLHGAALPAEGEEILVEYCD